MALLGEHRTPYPGIKRFNPNEFETRAIKTGHIYLANTGNEINIVKGKKVKLVISDSSQKTKHSTIT